MTAARVRPGTSPGASRRWVVPFAAALFAMLAIQMSSLGFSPLLPAMQSEFHFSYAELGFFTGLYGLLAMILSLPAGLAARRFGEKRVLLGGLAVVIIGLVVLSTARDFAVALAGRAIWTAGYRFAFVAVLTAVAVTCPPNLKSVSMGIVGSVASLASVIGAPLGGAIGAGFGWRRGMLMFAAASCAGLATAWLAYKSGDHSDTAARSPHATGPYASGALSMPWVWALAVLVGLIGMMAFSVTFFVPSAVRFTFGLDGVAAGWMISTGYLLGIFTNLYVGYLMDRHDKWTVMIAIAALLAPASLLLAVHDLVVFRATTAVVLALGFTATNQVYALAREVMDSRDAAGAMGVLSLGSGIFGYVGPQVLGVLRDRTGGFAVGWYVMAGAATLACAELVVLRSRVRGRRLTSHLR